MTTVDITTVDYSTPVMQQSSYYFSYACVQGSRCKNWKVIAEEFGDVSEINDL